ncbi:MAG: multidrug effflux MFS transporter [Silicimonas sp.]|nr:multidrug effflux MFS transporter [Silicimonas sp.]
MNWPRKPTKAHDTLQASTVTEKDVPISRIELVALLAMLSATVAFSIDAMLPAFPLIGAELSPSNPNRVQLIIASFLAGLGLGTFLAGPISDAYGRRSIVIGGSIIISVCAVIATLSSNLELLLAARFVQGIGASGPRIAAMAIVRDLFRGREMARVISFVIFVFTLGPVFAPLIGWGLSWAFGWRAIFYSFAVFSAVSMAWLLMRLPETHEAENRRPFRVGRLVEGVREVFGNRQVVLTIGAQSLVFGILMSTLMSSQQIFEHVFDQGQYFPLWFGFMAILAAFSNLMNAAIVVRLGMRQVIIRALVTHAIGSGMILLALVGDFLPPAWLFPVGFLWMTSNFYLAGFAIGNINAIALEPLGHIAGLAASIVTALSTILSIFLAAPIGQAFDGTLIPLVLGCLVLAILAVALIRLVTDTEA